MNSETDSRGPRYGMVVDLDKCNGCGVCMVACAVENNVPPAHARANERTGINWMQVHRVGGKAGDGEGRTAFVPVMCQHCGHETPCVEVCPQNAVERDPRTGIVAQIPVRCLGCRYCMTACPYHARSFNWWDPTWPGTLTETLNPDVSTRTRGVVEKCNFCSHRMLAERARLAASGEAAGGPCNYTPACAEACPTAAIAFGDTGDPSSEVSRLAADPGAFRLLETFGTEPRVHYLTRRPWVRALVEGGRKGERRHHG